MHARVLCPSIGFKSTRSSKACINNERTENEVRMQTARFFLLYAKAKKNDEAATVALAFFTLFHFVKFACM